LTGKTVFSFKKSLKKIKKILHLYVKGDKISRHFTRDGIFLLSENVNSLFFMRFRCLKPKPLRRKIRRKKHVSSINETAA
jgi:hypothetical protein